MKRIIAAVTALVVLGLVNASIYFKEQLLANGQVVYLELAPVDPRSIMQGDYMALNFALADAVYDTLPKLENSSRWRQNVDAQDGYVVVSLDQNRVASFKAIYDDQPLAESDLVMQFRVRNGTIKFATNAFFFQEGHAEVYQNARYGQFRVDDSGELLLTSLFDADLKKLEPPGAVKFASE
jgi:uncharacterized membrane-anchored protein